MLVLSGHGAGAMEGFLMDEERPLSLIPSSFPITKLKKVFDDKKLKRKLGRRKINILGFDACLMSMAEICYELRDIEILDLAIGSEGFSLNAGWPQDRIVRKIKDEPGIEPLALAKYIVKEHASFYSDYHLGGLSTDLTAVRLGRTDNLKGEIDALARAMIRKFDEEPRDRIPSDEGSSEENQLYVAVSGCDHPGALGGTVLQRRAVR
jgi:hypothetical protein